MASISGYNKNLIGQKVRRCLQLKISLILIAFLLFDYNSYAQTPALSPQSDIDGAKEICKNCSIGQSNPQGNIRAGNFGYLLGVLENFRFKIDDFSKERNLTKEFWEGIGIAVIIFIGLFIIHVIKLHRENILSDLHAEGVKIDKKSLDSIISYIRTMRKSGRDIDEISHDLINAGWDKRTIREITRKV